VIFNLLERRRDKWVEDGECYRWMAALANGRPQVGVKLGKWNYKGAYIARIMCEEAHGPPPTPKHDAAHDTPNGCIGGLCVNGEHLRWATRSENMLDIPLEERKAVAKIMHAAKPLEARALAKISGKKTYFSGKPCPRGHNGLRATSSGMCVECHRITANLKRDGKR
jgi:hypothetical protein